MMSFLHLLPFAILTFLFKPRRMHRKNVSRTVWQLIQISYSEVWMRKIHWRRARSLLACMQPVLWPAGKLRLLTGLRNIACNIACNIAGARGHKYLQRCKYLTSTKVIATLCASAARQGLFYHWYIFPRCCNQVLLTAIEDIHVTCSTIAVDSCECVQKCIGPEGKDKTCFLLGEVMFRNCDIV